MTTISLWLLGTVLFLAYSNGSNDNFKGVATLFGSGTTNYRNALWWATGTTFVGSLTAIAVSQGLIEAFSGKGLVPIELTSQAPFTSYSTTASSGWVSNPHSACAWNTEMSL